MKVNKIMAVSMSGLVLAMSTGTALADDGSQSVVFTADGTNGVDMVYIAHLGDEPQEHAEKELDSFTFDGSLRDGDLSIAVHDVVGSGISLAPDVYAEWAEDVIDEGTYKDEAEDFVESLESDDFSKAQEKYTQILDYMLSDNESVTLTHNVVVNVTSDDDGEFKGQVVINEVDIKEINEKSKDKGGDDSDNPTKVEDVDGQLVDGDELIDNLIRDNVV